MDRRRLLIALVTLGLIVLAVAPAVVAFSLGWLHPPHIQPWGQAAAKDTTSPERWAVFAVLYLFWMVGLMLLLVWSFDRLDYHWQYHERKPRAAKKKRRRQAAAMGFAAADEAARLEAMRRRAQRDAGRRADRALEAGKSGATRRGGSGGRLSGPSAGRAAPPRDHESSEDGR